MPTSSVLFCHNLKAACPPNRGAQDVASQAWPAVRGSQLQLTFLMSCEDLCWRQHDTDCQPFRLITVIVCDLLEPLLRKNTVPWCLHVAPHLVRRRAGQSTCKQPACMLHVQMYLQKISLLFEVTSGGKFLK
ncbi:hypothetical protein PHET_03200 [Paragonimus heterotremus]|uniref:Uncharacterized protein n=1 Tax=Paragonimus heterotremus TaxID=100268 RepID=A0A8J4WJD7_9TREM|nr:hypothetical protein PHET_03200 [Paragonimus heterotremus]